MEQEIEFDFNEILNQFRNGKRLTGVYIFYNSTVSELLS